MSSELTPEDVAARSFGHTLRGYDPRQVRAYLEDLSDQIRRLRGQYLAARQELGAIENEELETQIDGATTAINELLHAARIAAQQVTDQAARHAEDVTTRADQSAVEAHEAAEADAYQLRQSAWDTSAEMLDQVAREVARLRKSPLSEVGSVRAELVERIRALDP